jgi:hypothetical protein
MSSKNPLAQKSNSRRARIKYLSHQIASLTKELDRLLIDELDNRDQNIKIADEVEITNNHRGLQGRQGRVIKITDKQVTLTLRDGTTVQRSKKNIKKIA